jgi:hypothetical protein
MESDVIINEQEKRSIRICGLYLSYSVITTLYINAYFTAYVQLDN